MILPRGRKYRLYVEYLTLSFNQIEGGEWMHFVYNVQRLGSS